MSETDAFKKIPVQIFSAEGRLSQPMPLDLSIYKGKVVVLHLWSPSCAPCLREFRVYGELFKRKILDPEAVVILALSYLSPVTTAQSISKWVTQSLPSYGIPRQAIVVALSGKNGTELDEVRYASGEQIFPDFKNIPYVVILGRSNDVVFTEGVQGRISIESEVQMILRLSREPHNQLKL